MPRVYPSYRKAPGSDIGAQSDYPLQYLDFNPVSPVGPPPEVGPKADGASGKENIQPTLSHSNNVPMPDNTGPRTDGGRDMGRGVM